MKWDNILLEVTSEVLASNVSTVIKLLSKNCLHFLYPRKTDEEVTEFLARK